MDLKKFAEFIKELRKEKGLNQEQLADELLVHRTTVVKWEQGKALPLNDTLVMLSKYFNVSVDELLAGERRTNETPMEDKNKVTLSLLKSRRKSIFIAQYLGLLLFIIVIIFLIYYFFTTYNSIHVYLLSGYNDNIKTKHTLLIASNDKIYLRLGNIYDNKNKQIYATDVTLYVDDGYETKILFKGDPNQILVDYKDNVEIFDYKKLENDHHNLYLLIRYDDKEEIIKLKVLKDFENRSLLQLIFRNTTENYKPNDFNIKLSNKFKYDAVSNTFKLKDGKVKIECTEDIVCNVSIVEKNIDKYFEFDSFANCLYYKLIENRIVKEKGILNINNNLSINEEKIYIYFKEKILNKYLS